MCEHGEICTAVGLIPGKEQRSLRVKTNQYREIQPKIDPGTHCLVWKPEISQLGSYEYYILIQKCELNYVQFKKFWHSKQLGSCYKFPAVSKI